MSKYEIDLKDLDDLLCKYKIKDLKDLEERINNNKIKNCDTCQNKFLCCLSYRNEPCDGYNDYEVFKGLMKFFLMGVPGDFIEERFKTLEHVKEKHGGNK